MGKRAIEDIANQTNIHKPNTSIENHLEFWQEAVSNYCPSLELNLTCMKDVSRIPLEIIPKIITLSEDEDIISMNEYLWDASVASTDEIIRDIEYGLENDKIMFAEPEMAQSFTIRATPGHAQSGHSTFLNNRKPNTCITDVLNAIEEVRPKKFYGPNTREHFQKTSQTNIDNIVYCMEDWLDYAEQNLDNINSKSSIIQLRNRDGTPLNGFSYLKGTLIDILEGKRAFRFTTLMDNLPQIRKSVRNKYGCTMGGGESYLTVTSKLKQYGIDIPHLSETQHQGIFKILNFVTSENRIKILTELGVIKDKALDLEKISSGECTWDEIKADPNVTNLLENPNFSVQYIRSEKGLGVGDDISINLSALLPQTYTKRRHIESHCSRESRIYLGLMGDQIDTLEKDAELFMPAGQDEIAGHYINGRFRKLCRQKKFRRAFDIKLRKDGQYDLLDKDVIVDFTGASANTKAEHIHSSQRWMYKQVKGTCAISEYFRHLYSNTEPQERATLKPNICNFVNLREIPPKDTRLTFRQITLGDMRTIIDRRSALVANPYHREENLLKFYSKT